MTQQNRDSWFVFCTVRNPWDLAVSWILRWFSLYKPDDTPEKIDADTAERIINRAWFVENGRMFFHLGDVDHFVRYETLDSGLAKLLARFDLELPELPWYNRSMVDRGPYQEHYTEDGAQYIADRFEEEIGELGYEF